MTYKEISGCEECPVKTNGFCEGANKENAPICLLWSPDTDVDKVVFKLLSMEGD